MPPERGLPEVVEAVRPGLPAATPEVGTPYSAAGPSKVGPVDDLDSRQARGGWADGEELSDGQVRLPHVLRAEMAPSYRRCPPRSGQAPRPCSTRRSARGGCEAAGVAQQGFAVGGAVRPIACVMGEVWATTVDRSGRLGGPMQGDRRRRRPQVLGRRSASSSRRSGRQQRAVPPQRSRLRSHRGVQGLKSWCAYERGSRPSPCRLACGAWHGSTGVSIDQLRHDGPGARAAPWAASRLRPRRAAGGGRRSPCAIALGRLARLEGQQVALLGLLRAPHPGAAGDFNGQVLAVRRPTSSRSRGLLGIGWSTPPAPSTSSVALPGRLKRGPPGIRGLRLDACGSALVSPSASR